MPATVEEAQERYATSEDYTILDLEADLDRLMADKMGLDVEQPDHDRFEEFVESEEDVTQATPEAILRVFVKDYVDEGKMDEGDVSSVVAMAAAFDDHAESLIPPGPDDV